MLLCVKEGRSKTSLCYEGWCFAGRWGGGGAELPWEFCKPPPWHHRLQTPSTPHHILSTCNLWPCLLLIVEWDCAHKQSPPAQARLASLWSWPAFLYLSPCENTGSPASPILKYLPQEGRYIIFPGPLLCLCAVIACFVNALQSKPVQTFLGNGTFKR